MFKNDTDRQLAETDYQEYESEFGPFPEQGARGGGTVGELEAIKKELNKIAMEPGNVPAYQLTLEVRALAMQVLKLADVVAELVERLSEDRMFEESENSNV